MAKKKKDKLKEVVPEKKPVKEYPNAIEFKQFRIVRADQLNYGIDERSETGFKGVNQRRYFPSLECALEGALKQMVLLEDEEKNLKKAVKKIKGYKEEILQAIKGLKAA